jgi:hypothetical protein
MEPMLGIEPSDPLYESGLSPTGTGNMGVVGLEPTVPFDAGFTDRYHYLCGITPEIYLGLTWTSASNERSSVI